MKGMSNLYNDHIQYQCPYYGNTPMYNPHNMYNGYNPYPNPNPYYSNTPMHYPNTPNHCIKLKDYGPCPFVINIEEATIQNNNFRLALWTGTHLQLTLMSINVGEDIGLECHPDVDQFIRIEEGEGLVLMGDSECSLDFQKKVCDDYAILIPAGKWHNLINIGNTPIKLYSIYAPPEHPRGTIHETKADADEDHH